MRKRRVLIILAAITVLSLMLASAAYAATEGGYRGGTTVISAGQTQSPAQESTCTSCADQTQTQTQTQARDGSGTACDGTCDSSGQRISAGQTRAQHGACDAATRTGDGPMKGQAGKGNALQQRDGTCDETCDGVCDLIGSQSTPGQDQERQRNGTGGR